MPYTKRSLAWLERRRYSPSTKKRLLEAIANRQGIKIEPQLTAEILTFARSTHQDLTAQEIAISSSELSEISLNDDKFATETDHD